MTLGMQDVQHADALPIQNRKYIFSQFNPKVIVSNLAYFHKISNTCLLCPSCNMLHETVEIDFSGL